jgi:hypothetical protein
MHNPPLEYQIARLPRQWQVLTNYSGSNMNSKSILASALAATLIFSSVSAMAHPPGHADRHRGHHHGHHRYPPPPPPPRQRYDATWVAPAIIGGIGLGYLLSQPSTRTVIVEQPVYEQRCDEATTYDRYGNRTTTRTCY